MTDFKTLDFDISEGIATITLNRPDNANTLNLDMAEDLFEATLACEADDSVRAVILTAKGRMFCAGGDLAAFHASGAGLPTTLNRTATALHNAVSLLARMDAPLVIGVNGTAAGAGLSLVLMGDYVLASDKAKFTMAYTGAGLSPDGSSSFFLAKHIGLLRAKELVLTNRVLSAEEAAAWGAVSRVVPGESLEEETRAMAQTFAKGPTRAYGESKRLLLSAYSETLETQIEFESRGIVSQARGKDGAHGIEAFLKKEKPVFEGK